MKPAKTYWIIAGMIALFVSCKTMQPFTDADQSLVVSGTAETPFRVLQITDRQDSLLLRKSCDDLKNFAADSAFHWLVVRMKKTLEIENGVGIAAPQVGISKNLFLFMRLDLPDKPVQVAVNPKIVNHPDTTICFEGDGCLSIPGRSGNSVRYPWIEVEYLNEKGEKIRERLEGYSRQNTFTAVIFQHEYDHTKGILFTDKLCE
ncbi:MAG: peptide deformylase [Dysgonamonadaceae bacterium]|jgi:peptide deformylase|nr:peptide deformylase [Dysgonamonadaceae bacterium]